MGDTYILRKGIATLNDLVDGYSAIMATANDVYYVDKSHANASDGNEGKDPNKPMLTIAGGYGRCADGRGDVVFIKGLDRYRENQLSVTKEAISFIGAGWGTEWNRTSSQTGDYVLKVMDADQVNICNMHLSGQDQSEDVIYYGQDASNEGGANCGIIENCLISCSWWTATPTGTKTGLYLARATFMRIRNNFFYACPIGLTIVDGGEGSSHGLIVENNYFNCGSYGIYWNGAYGQTSVIKGNTFWDWTSAVNMTYGVYLNLSTGGTLVADNNFGCAEPVYDAGDLNYWVGNRIRITEAASEDFALSQEAFC